MTKASENTSLIEKVVGPALDFRQCDEIARIADVHVAELLVHLSLPNIDSVVA